MFEANVYALPKNRTGNNPEGKTLEFSRERGVQLRKRVQSLRGYHDKERFFSGRGKEYDRGKYCITELYSCLVSSLCLAARPVASRQKKTASELDCIVEEWQLPRN